MARWGMARRTWMLSFAAVALAAAVVAPAALLPEPPRRGWPPPAIDQPDHRVQQGLSRARTPRSSRLPTRRAVTSTKSGWAATAGSVFAASADGGLHFSKPVVLAGSAGRLGSVARGGA